VAVTNFIGSDARGIWAETICDLTGYDKAFPLCSGSEANDAAIKLALKHHWLRTGKHGYVLSMDGCYFGRTIGANSASAGAHPHYEVGIGHWDRIINTPREKFLWAIGTMGERGELAGIITEILPGRALAGGFISDETLAAIFEFRKRYNFAIIVDEVKTGGGRLGTYLGTDMWAERPDIVTLSKTLAAGLPMAAVLATYDMWEGIDHSWHSSTMGGNPALCAYSTHLLSKVTPSMLSSVLNRGDYLHGLLSNAGFDFVGRGLHQNIFVQNAFKVRDKLIDHGFLVYCIREDYICIMPNMYTTEEQLAAFVDALWEIAK